MFQYFNQNSLIILVFLIALLIFFLPMRNAIYKVIFFGFSIFILLILKSLFMPSYENIGQKEIIHFIGIGGIGMSGLAQIMKNMGFKVQGSDVSLNKNIERLKDQIS